MRRLSYLLVLATIACAEGPSRVADGSPSAQKVQLPTGAWLDPVTPSVPLGSMPLAVAVSPRGDRLAVSLSGWREQGVQILDRASGRVLQTIAMPAAFLGLAFSRSGDTLYASGGFRDVIYEVVFHGGEARIGDSISLAATSARRTGRYYPAGIALSPNGQRLYVAENLADSLAVIDVAQRRVVQRLPLGRYPYGVTVASDGTVYVSIWGANVVTTFAPRTDGLLSLQRNITVGRHPSAMLLSRDGSRLFVASASTDRVTVLDPHSGTIAKELRDPPLAGPDEGSTPNALALSPNGTRLYVAEADNNAVAVFDLTRVTSGVSNATGRDSLAGRVPVDWYPTALASLGDTLLVVSGKGRGTGPNPDGSTPFKSRDLHKQSYTLGQLDGSLTLLPPASVSASALAASSRSVAAANGWNQATRTRASYPPFQHVIYVIKENRTYDQVLGDLTQADGDTSLALFPRANTPNHHALAERFGIFDRFFVNAEVSADGHNWSMAAYATDYVEKTVASHYSARGRTYDYEGTNRGHRDVDGDDVNEPAMGYLWDLAMRGKITFRNYGEFVSHDGAPYVGNKPFLSAHTNPDYPGFDLEQTDQHRMDVWQREFESYVRDGTMPQLEIMRLPNDHTAALAAGAVAPRSLVADNDLALGRLIEALSKSPFWKNTVVFVLEDDAQNGPDHVDSHRSELFVISAYNAPGVYHRFTNTTDVVATIAGILHLGALSQFDYYGRPLRDVFSSTPNLTPYSALTPAISLTDRNPRRGAAESESRKLDLSEEDRADEDLFNKVLWRALKGDSVPYPGVRRASVLDVRRAQ